jgi:hypothetical protein
MSYPSARKAPKDTDELIHEARLLLSIVLEKPKSQQFWEKMEDGTLQKTTTRPTRNG